MNVQLFTNKLYQFPGNLLLELEVVSTTTAQSFSAGRQSVLFGLLSCLLYWLIFHYLLHKYFQPAEALQFLCSTLWWFLKEKVAAEYGWVISLAHTAIASAAHFCVLKTQRRLHPETLKAL